MPVKQLNVKEQHYADTREEAENVVNEAKEDPYLIRHAITEKHNKFGKYFLIDLAFSYETPRDIMQKAADEKEAENTNRSTREGAEYTVNGDGTVDVKTDNVATKTMYFEHEGTGDFIKVEKGESLDFLNDDIFDERTEEEYEDWLDEQEDEQ